MGQSTEYWGNVNPIGPRSCYDEGKRCAETLFFDYRRQHNLGIKVARIFNTYGPRMHPRDGRVVSNFIVQALQNQDITVYGDGSQTRSFCYVDDLVEGLMRLMGTPEDVTGPINLGNPNEFTIKQLALSVIELTNSSSRIEYKTLPTDDPKQRQPNIQKAMELLDWKPTIQLKDGLKQTIAYFDRLLREERIPAI
jgi:UDP-glucuronate decarboxylase